MFRRKKPREPEKRFRLGDGRIVSMFRKKDVLEEGERTFLTLKNEQGKPICELGFEITGKKGFFYKARTKGKPLFSKKEKSYQHLGCAETLLRLSLREMKEKGVKRVEAPFLPESGKEGIASKMLKDHGFEEPNKLHLPPLAAIDMSEEVLERFEIGLPTYILKDLTKLKIGEPPLKEVEE